MTRGPGFKITGGKGFHITLANGWTVSVQFGPGNYCDHYDRHIGVDDAACGKEGSTTAEIAYWYESGALQSFSGDEHDTVKARVSPDEVVALLADLAQRVAAVPEPCEAPNV